jgi:predicted AAA+ superfamily ATPase
MINRTLEPEIIKDLAYFPALAIVGPRQSGKTTLAKMLMAHSGKPTIYLDLESVGDTYRLQDPESFFLAHEDHCIVLDEVQLMAHPLLGASWEGYVIEQIRLLTMFRWQYYYYRTHAGAESDLYLISPEGKTCCIEIKAANTPIITKGFFQSIDDLKPDFKYVIVPEGKGDMIVRSDGLKICSLKIFLEQELLAFK